MASDGPADNDSKATANAETNGPQAPNPKSGTRELWDKTAGSVLLV
jgi:hypothetical protein